MCRTCRDVQRFARSVTEVSFQRGAHTIIMAIEFHSQTSLFRYPKHEESLTKILPISEAPTVLFAHLLDWKPKKRFQ